MGTCEGAQAAQLSGSVFKLPCNELLTLFGFLNKRSCACIHV